MYPINGVKYIKKNLDYKNIINFLLLFVNITFFIYQYYPLLRGVKILAYKNAFDKLSALVKIEVAAGFHAVFAAAVNHFFADAYIRALAVFRVKWDCLFA